MRSLGARLTVAFLLVSLIGIALVAFFAVRVTASEFGSYVDEQAREVVPDALVAYYAETGGWQGADDRLYELLGSSYGREVRVVLFDKNGRLALPQSGGGPGGGGPGSGAMSGLLSEAQTLTVAGEVVGYVYIGSARGGPYFETPGVERDNFVGRVNYALFLGALGAAAVSLVLGVLLARSLTRPIKALTAATRAVADGELGRQVDIRARDELGELAHSFNQMSRDLAEARDQRRQMTADIAHELRTPLSIILGHAEALSDGVLPPDAETFAIIHDESQHLQRMIEDLRTLSLAETGELPLVRQPITAAELLERAAAAYRPALLAAEVTLALDIAPDLPVMDADPDRIGQVLGNLIRNALRHTPAGGRITLSAARAPGGVELRVADTGPGIATADLPHIFDRFYRADKSRQRAGGGTGLGLAIARSIVARHGGELRVESHPGQGAVFVVKLVGAG